MKKVILFLLFVTLLVGTAQAQSLRFRADGTFHIVQFTDLHYKLHNPAAKPATDCIDRVLDAERPDLVVITGDVVYSKPADSTLQVILDHVSAHGIPFVMTFGNHDGERGMAVEQLYPLITRTSHCIAPKVDKGVSPDYSLPILGHAGNKVEALVYCFDTHNHAQIKDVGGYAWLTPEQVAWYEHESEAWKTKNGRTVPALAFMHIPVPEYAEAARSEGTILRGTRWEEVCCPKINTGMFAAMRLSGDVMGIFCGHDHDNDYTAMWHGILLGYGRFSGGNTEYNHLPNGARVIILKEGQRSFDTYIRQQKDGTVVDRTTFPSSYVKDDWRARPQP